VGKQVEKILRSRGVNLHLEQTVNQVEAAGDEKIISCESGLKVTCDRLFWVTQASAAPWLKEAGLATDENGFIQVDDTLRSLSHPHIFAAGDVAQVYDPLTGHSVHDSLWGPARQQGYAAGLNMAGKKTTYVKSAPFNVTRLAGLTTTIIGTE
jgi:NADPH-dependent 2,4-dienoyl-CoA reductase/sulfur reductase-like enzyme